jgi:hypothetical protein
MLSKKNLLGIVVLALAPTLMAPSCNDVVTDPTFRLWCGDELCAWKTEKGSVRRAPTWHKKDYGVELVDTPTVISQSTDRAPRCLEFTAVADVEPSAQVTVGLDFNRDGSVDFEQPIAQTGFREAKTQVTAPLFYDGVRFVVTKKGQGRAVLAEVRVETVEGCTAPPLALRDLPIGTPCSLQNGGAECRSGICCDHLCSECCFESSIGETRADGTFVKNEPRACANGGACKRAGPGPSMRGFVYPAVPLQCDPGAKKKPAGAECLASDDCASGACEGAGSTAVDPSSKAPCDAHFPDPGGEGCVFTTTAGGRCR